MQLNPSVVTMPQSLDRAGYQTTFVTNDHHNLAIEMGFGWGFQKIRLTNPTFDDATQKIWMNAIDDIQTANKAHKPAFVYFHTDHVHDYDRKYLNPPMPFPLDPTYRPKITFDTEFTEQTWKHSIDYLNIMIATDWGTVTIEEEKAWQDRFLQASSLQEAKSAFKQLPKLLQEELIRNQAQNYLYGDEEKAYITFGRHLYDNAIQTADEFLGTVLKQIARNKLDDNTIVIIVSDHGQLLGEDGTIGHILGMNNKEIHVPLIMHIPKFKSQRVDELTQHIDISPTLMELVGIPKSRKHTGISLVGLLTNAKNAPRNEFVISQTIFPNPIESVQTNQWRLIEATLPSGSIQQTLYDLRNDPEQSTDVAQRETQTVYYLSRLLRDINKRQTTYTPEEMIFPIWYDVADRQRKIDSGYFFQPSAQAK